MNFYKHHIGDYAAATAHLSFIEDAAFSRLLRIYYRDEKALPVEVKAVQRLAGARAPDELEAVETVLREFFTLAEDGWHSKRCDEEISKAQAQADTNRAIAEAREARKRATIKQRTEHESCNEPLNHSSPVREPSQTPDSRLQTKEEAKATVQPSAAPSRFLEFWALYPCKKGKADAAKRWHKDKLDRIADEILANVRHMLEHDDQWKRGYIPHGSTYLNQSRWTDEAQPAPVANGHTHGKTMGGLLALEAMKHGNGNGLATNGSHHGAAVAALPFAGADPFGGGSAGYGDCLDAEFVEVGVAPGTRHPADS